MVKDQAKVYRHLLIIIIESRLVLLLRAKDLVHVIDMALWSRSSGSDSAGKDNGQIHSRSKRAALSLLCLDVHYHSHLLVDILQLHNDCRSFEMGQRPPANQHEKRKSVLTVEFTHSLDPALFDRGSLFKGTQSFIQYNAKLLHALQYVQLCD